MIQMAPPVEDYILDEMSTHNFDFTKLGVSFEFTNTLLSEETIEEYQQLRERTELLNLNNKQSYLNINYNMIKEEGFTVQGLTKIEDRIVISAYNKNDYSRLYVFDTNTSELIGKIILNNKAHVGGIAYDKDNNIIYVTGEKGEINSYNANIIKNLTDSIVDLNEQSLAESIINNNIILEDSGKTYYAATIYYYNNQLYVGTFSPVGKGNLYIYNVEYDQKNQIINIKEQPQKYIIGPRVQGITITKIGDKQYLLCSQSIGFSNSSIIVYELGNDNIKYIGKTYLKDHGLEEIIIDDNNNLLGIFENNNIPIMVKKVDEIFSELRSSFLEEIPGNELEAIISGAAYKTFR